MQSFSVMGNWWLPNTQSAAGGTLSFAPDMGLRLELAGALVTGSGLERLAQTMGMTAYQNHPMIHGLTTDNKVVTLYDCDLAGTTMRSNGLPGQRYVIGAAFFGVHAASPVDLVFPHASVQYTHLAAWVGQAQFGTRRSSTETITTYAYPAAITAVLPDATLRITKRAHVAMNQRSYTITEHVWVEYDSSQPLSLHDWLESHLALMQHLLSLATTRPNAITRLQFETMTSDPEDPADTPQRTTIDVFFNAFYQGETDPLPTWLYPEKMLFTLADIPDLQDLLNRWYQITTELETVNDLFFGAHYAPPRYTSSRFLVNVQALEVYDRIRFSNSVAPKQNYRQKVESIINAVPEEHRVWLKGMLQYGNEPRLLERIQRVVERAGDVIIPLVQDAAQFAKLVKDTRNYFTHFSISVKPRAARGTDLYWLNTALVLLMQRCYLYELGFSSEESIVLFERNANYRHASKKIILPWIQEESIPWMNEPEAEALIEEICAFDAQLQPQLRAYGDDYDPATGALRFVVIITDAQTGAEQGFRHRDEWIAYHQSLSSNS